MGFNADLAAALEEMSRLLELTGANRFKVNALAKGARVVESIGRDLEPIAGDPDELQAIDGIGKGIAEKIGEFAETRSIEELDELRAEVPSGLMRVMEIPGLGPKTVRAMWTELKVEDLDGLRRVIDDGTLAELPRMGAKAVQRIKDALAFAERAGKRLHLGVALPLAEVVVEHLQGVDGVQRIAYAGSLRRGKETIGDVDLLVVADDPAAVHEAFRTMPKVERVIGSGETKTSVLVDLSDVPGGRWGAMEGAAVQMDLRTVPEASWGAALMYFTGSKEHNVVLRERAQKRGLTLNEYGLFPDDDQDTPPQSRGVEPVASDTEEAIYDALELRWVPPELREDRGELNADDVGGLITVEDIRAELHAHTNASDGSLTLDELIEAAKARGFHTITVTDHSKSSVQANGLSVERLREQADAIDAANERHTKITVLKGSEVDILADGTLDYDDDVLAALEVVVASPHAALRQDTAKATARLIKAIEHPLVHIIGHPTGRLIERRPGLDLAMDEIIAAAKEHDTALEINAHWLRLDLRDTHVRAAVEAGVKIAIDCDVHSAEDFENIRYGVLTGRRGWLPASLCVNTWTKAKLHTWLASKR